MRRGFAAVFIAALILIQVGFFVDNDTLNLQMSTISKDHEQGHENQITLDILLVGNSYTCLLYTSPSPRDLSTSRMPSSA